jgi:hypothetical protein
VALDPWLRVAWHEAAHVLAGFAIGAPPSRAWIGAGRDSFRLGATETEPDSPPVPWPWLLAFAIAGPAGEALAVERYPELRPAGFDGYTYIAGDDLDLAVENERRCPWLPAPVALERIAAWVRRPEVLAPLDRVAAELLRLGELDGRVLWQLAAQDGAGGPGWARRWGLPLRRSFPAVRPTDPTLRRRTIDGVFRAFVDRWRAVLPSPSTTPSTVAPWGGPDLPIQGYPGIAPGEIVAPAASQGVGFP